MWGNLLKFFKFSPKGNKLTKPRKFYAQKGGNSSGNVPLLQAGKSEPSLTGLPSGNILQNPGPSPPLSQEALQKLASAGLGQRGVTAAERAALEKTTPQYAQEFAKAGPNVRYDLPGKYMDDNMNRAWLEFELRQIDPKLLTKLPKTPIQQEIETIKKRLVNTTMMTNPTFLQDLERIAVLNGQRAKIMNPGNDRISTNIRNEAQMDINGFVGIKKNDIQTPDVLAGPPVPPKTPLANKGETKEGMGATYSPQRDSAYTNSIHGDYAHFDVPAAAPVANASKRDSGYGESIASPGGSARNSLNSEFRTDSNPVPPIPLKDGMEGKSLGSVKPETGRNISNNRDSGYSDTSTNTSARNSYSKSSEDEMDNFPAYREDMPDLIYSANPSPRSSMSSIGTPKTPIQENSSSLNKGTWMPESPKWRASTPLDEDLPAFPALMDSPGAYAEKGWGIA